MKNNKNSLKRWALSCLLAIVALPFPSSDVQAAEFCSDSYYVDETLANGSRWDMCWEHRQREGIIFHHVFYTPKNGQRRMIFNHAAVAQIHVPYDDNGARYHDISDYGIGGNNILSLNADECPAGTLLQYSGKNVLCKQIETRQVAFKSANNTDSGNSLSLFSVSPVGAYYYIPKWRFMDDGTIEPWIGATGALQRFGNNQSRGWKMGDGRTGIAHLHNFYWKLDFDLNETHLNDAVEEVNFPLVNGKRQRTTSTFTSETSRKINPESMRHWRVRDTSLANANGRASSYDILINESGHQDIGPSSEPFTQNDFYVTRQRNEEKFASHNPTGGENLAEFVNGETLTNNDIVIWAGVTFYHMPRSEDAPHMDAHWSHIKIVPRDWHASNPLVDPVVNTPPTISSIGNQNSLQGSSVSFNIVATDIDADDLSYSANGLPSGLTIDGDTGLISGTANTTGNYTVTVSVNDGSDTSTRQFNWTVTAVSPNTAPQITNPSNQSGQVGNDVNLQIQASDADGDSLSFSATGLPAGLQINTATGLINGILNTASSNTVVVTVNDGTDTANTQFNWIVNAQSGSVSNEVSNNLITINGVVNDWAGLNYYANDPDDTSGTNNQIDWLKVAIAHSPDTVFMTYQNRQNVDSNNSTGTYIPWGWTAYLDTDNNAATGYQQDAIGADYIISGNVIERYIGTGTSWSWDVVANTTLQYSGANVEMRFARSLIGNPQNLKVIFVGDNAAFSGDIIDRYPDSGSFSYAFTGVSNPNSAPIAINQQLSVVSETPLSLLLSASDIDNDALTYQLTQQPSNGSISGIAPNLVYTSNAAYIGADNFTFKANDGTVDSQEATVTIDVTSGQTPVAVSNYVSTPIVINGNDSEWSELNRFDSDTDDASGNIDWQSAAFAHDDTQFYLTYENFGNVDPESNSGTYLAWGWQTYIDVDQNASTGFQAGSIGADYVLEGNQLQRYTGTGNNWSWQAIGVLESSYSGNIAELAFSRNQIGNPDSIRVVFSGNSTSYGGTGTDLYPNGQNNNQASVQFFNYDFTGGNSGGNDRPIAFTQSVTVNADESVNITLLASDPDNNVLSYNIVSNPDNGTLTGVAPNITYTPATSFVGQDSFSFNVNDGTTNSATAVVNINVVGEQNGAYSNLVASIDVDGNIEDWSSLSSFNQDAQDISGNNNVIDWQRAAIAHSATDLYFMYQNYNSINIDNNSGDFINWGWQTFIDSDENSSTGYQVGTIGADYILEGTQLQRYTGSGNDWSWDNFATATVSYNANTAELSFARSLITNPSQMRVLFQGNNGAYGGNSVDNYPDALDYFEYQLSGGTQTTSNRPIANTMNIEVTSNSVTSISLSGSDQDNDALSYRLVGQPSNGSITDFDGTAGSISYQANAGFSGIDSFRYIATDGTYESSVQVVTLNVSATGSTGDASGGGSIPLPITMILGFLLLFRKKKLASSLGFFLLTLPVFLFSFSSVNAAEHCSDEYYIDETFTNGARWDMCWEHRSREGITLSGIYFTPKNGVRRMVLNHAAVAQIHVPYDDNGSRYHDVTDLGLGDLNMLDIQSDECPTGTRLQFNTKHVICQQIEKRNVAFKTGSYSSPGYSLNLFSVSPVGAYYYIPTWHFLDNGTIEVSMGATGTLQRFGTDADAGWKLGDDRIGIAHLHNFFWKFDFDVNKTHLDDVVEEVNFNLVNGKRERSITPFDTEVARSVNPNTMRYWRIRDTAAKNNNGHTVSYDIMLNETGHQEVGPSSEAFTHNDFYVTKQKNNEKFASHNPAGAEDLAQFVDGESLQNNDLVVWAGITFYHMPRSEDIPHMDAHWSHLKIIPRDSHDENALANIPSNTAPSIQAIDAQSSNMGTPLSLTIQVADLDGDSLLYSAIGLPEGLSLDATTGEISGTATTIGNYSVLITVSDGQLHDSTKIDWTISETSGSGSGGGGSFASWWVLVFLIFLGLNSRRRQCRHA